VAKLRNALADTGIGVVLAKPNAFGESIIADLGVEPGTERDAIVRIKPAPEWAGGGLLAARAALADLERRVF
jgi:hypothetical protein